MPTYQYRCTSTDCGNEFELVQSFTDSAASECPVCDSPVRKVFSAVGVVFKGSGFYRNDSRAGATAKSSSGSSSASSTSSSSDASSSSTSAASSSGSSDGSSSSSSTGGSSAKPAAAASA